MRLTSDTGFHPQLCDNTKNLSCSSKWLFAYARYTERND